MLGDAATVGAEVMGGMVGEVGTHTAEGIIIVMAALIGMAEESAATLEAEVIGVDLMAGEVSVVVSAAVVVVSAVGVSRVGEVASSTILAARSPERGSSLFSARRATTAS